MYILSLVLYLIVGLMLTANGISIIEKPFIWITIMALVCIIDLIGFHQGMNKVY